MLLIKLFTAVFFLCLCVPPILLCRVLFFFLFLLSEWFLKGLCHYYNCYDMCLRRFTYIDNEGKIEHTCRLTNCRFEHSVEKVKRLLAMKQEDEERKGNIITTSRVESASQDAEYKMNEETKYSTSSSSTSYSPHVVAQSILAAAAARYPTLSQSHSTTAAASRTPHMQSSSTSWQATHDIIQSQQVMSQQHSPHAHSASVQLPSQLPSAPVPVSLSHPSIVPDLFSCDVPVVPSPLPPLVHQCYYPLGSLLLTPSTFSLHSIVRQPPTQPFPQSLIDQTCLLVPTGPMSVEQQHEYDSRRGEWSDSTRQLDALYWINRFQSMQLLTAEIELLMVYRYGAEGGFTLMLHFSSADHREAVRQRFEREKQKKQQTQTQSWQR